MPSNDFRDAPRESQQEYFGKINTTDFQEKLYRHAVERDMWQQKRQYDEMIQKYQEWQARHAGSPRYAKDALLSDTALVIETEDGQRVLVGPKLFRRIVTLIEMAELAKMAPEADPTP